MSESRGGTGTRFATGPGGARGDADYRAPEQLLGLPLDPTADVFALGIVIYEIVLANGHFRMPAASKKRWIACRFSRRRRVQRCQTSRWST